MRSALRKLAGPFFIGAGALHFVRPEPYRAIMPPYIPAPDAMVALSGVAEAAGGAGLLVPGTRRWAGWWLVATLVAIFPANVHMALHPERYERHVPGRARRAVSAAAVPARVHRLGARRRPGGRAGGAAVIGQRVRRREDPRFLTGNGRYVDDLELDGALWATFVRSEYAHATITEIDTSELPDGAQVFTAADIDLEPPPPMHPAIDAHMARPPIASGKVRFVGEIIAIVVTDTAPPASTPPNASGPRWSRCPRSPTSVRRSANETLLFEEAGTNVAMADGPTEPSADLFDGCDVVVEGELNSQRIHVAPIEPRATAAVWENGRLRIWLSTQTPHQDRDALADGARGRARPRARDRAGRRRRLRRQGAAARGRAGGVAGAQARPAGALDRDALRAHGRDGPRPRPADLVHARRHPRRGPQGAVPAAAAGLRRLPRHRRDPADADAADGVRRVPDSADRGPV